MPQQSESGGSFGDLWQILAANRPGFVGFWLSTFQLLSHTAWILLALNGPVNKDGQAVWESWRTTTVETLVICGAILTAVSLGMCMYGAMYRRPRVLALVGLSLSFFIGVLTTFIVVLSFLSR